MGRRLDTAREERAARQGRGRSKWKAVKLLRVFCSPASLFRCILSDPPLAMAALPSWWGAESAVLGGQRTKEIPRLRLPVLADEENAALHSWPRDVWRSLSARLFGKEEAPADAAVASKGAMPSWWTEAISATPSTQEAVQDMRSSDDPSASHESPRGAAVAKPDDGLPEWWSQKQMSLVSMVEGTSDTRNGRPSTGSGAKVTSAVGESGGCCVVS